MAGACNLVAPMPSLNPSPLRLLCASIHAQHWRDKGLGRGAVRGAPWQLVGGGAVVQAECERPWDRSRQSEKGSKNSSSFPCASHFLVLRHHEKTDCNFCFVPRRLFLDPCLQSRPRRRRRSPFVCIVLLAGGCTSGHDASSLRGAPRFSHCLG